MWLLWGFILSTAIGYAAYRKESLDRSGVAGAIVTGTLIFGLGGWQWGVVLIAFFVTSSLLSSYRAVEKERLAEKFAKGSRRDLGQALANGGLGALLAVGSAVRPHPLWLAAYVGAMATVTADTWATELGVLSKTAPRLITTGRAVEVGTSGGVTWLGTAATMAGGTFIGLLAGALNLPAGSAALMVALTAGGLAGGLAGSLFDSLLGATVQAVYYCPTCAKETESALHRCLTPARQLRGWRWLNNDLVNFASSLLGAVAAATLGLLWL